MCFAKQSIKSKIAWAPIVCKIRKLLNYVENWMKFRTPANRIKTAFGVSKPLDLLVIKLRLYHIELVHVGEGYCRSFTHCLNGKNKMNFGGLKAWKGPCSSLNNGVLRVF